MPPVVCDAGGVSHPRGSVLSERLTEEVKLAETKGPRGVEVKVSPESTNERETAVVSEQIVWLDDNVRVAEQSLYVRTHFAKAKLKARTGSDIVIG